MLKNTILRSPALASSLSVVCVPTVTFVTLQQLGHTYFRVGLVHEELLLVLCFLVLTLIPIEGCVTDLVGVPPGVGYCTVLFTFLLVIVMLEMFDEEVDVEEGDVLLRRNQSVFRDEDLERFSSLDGE